jgi:hypothetical protein
MKKIKIEKTLLVAALALGLAASASAQSTEAMSAAPATAPDSYNGLVGANYAELSFGYLKEEATPDLFHDYQFVYNEPVKASGGVGFDANFTYDYMTGGAWGYHDYRNEALLGATAYLQEGWGKPFVTADVGWALQQSADRVENSYAYALTAGAEFQLTGRLVLTPFLEYEAEPRLRQDNLSVADLPDYVFNYAAKATYRVSQDWSVSLTAELDQHSASDLGLRAGASYHF